MIGWHSFCDWLTFKSPIPKKISFLGANPVGFHHNSKAPNIWQRHVQSGDTVGAIIHKERVLKGLESQSQRLESRSPKG